MAYLTIVGVTTSSISFDYETVEGTGFFGFFLNGVEQELGFCSSKYTNPCVISGLSPGTTYKLDVCCKPNTITPCESTLTIYPTTNSPINSLTFTAANQVAYVYNGLYFSWSVSGGSGSAISYTIQGNSLNILQGYTENSITISSLLSGVRYQITVTGYQDGYSTSNSFYVTIFANPPTTLTLDSATNSLMTVRFQTIGGFDGETYYTIRRDGNNVPGCVGITTTSCIITGLSAATSYTIRVVTVNRDSTLTYDQVFSTAADPISSVSVAPLIITAATITFEISSVGGAAGKTLYNTKSNSIDIASCSNTALSSCKLIQLLPNTNYNIQVSALNSGNTVSTSAIIMTMPSVNITSFSMNSSSATTISIQYNSQFGISGQTNYTISVNNLTIPNCYQINSLFCTISNLNPSTYYDIVLVASNEGFNNQQLKSFSTGPSISITSINTVNVSSSGLTVNYDSVNGISSSTYYSISLNGTIIIGCQNSTSLSCKIINLFPSTIYSINVVATSEGISDQKSTSFETLPSVKITNFTMVSHTTKSIKISYSSENSISGVTQYSVYINGTQFNDCINIEETFCIISNLLPNTTYSIQLMATSDGMSDSKILELGTLPSVSDPSIEIVQKQNQTLEIVYFVDGGLPNESLYNVSVNGSLVPTCINTNETRCFFYPYNYGQFYFIQVTVQNEGTIKNSIENIFIYLLPSKIEINSTETTSQIVIVWNESKGGYPNSTKYQALMSSDGIDFIVVCDNITTKFYCKFDNLIQNTTYFIKVSVLNTNFDPVNTTISVNTLKNTQCKYSNEDEIDCSGKGQCSNGLCICQNDFTGQFCEINLPNKVDPPIVIPNPDGPIIIVNHNGILFNFSVTYIREIDYSLNQIKSFNLTSVKWILTTNEKRNITNSLNGMLSEQIWEYSIKSDSLQNYCSAINIIFYQYLPIPGITKNDYYEYEFAGQLYSIKLGSVKYSLNVTKWNFESKLNSLELDSTISSPVGGSCDREINVILSNSSESDSFYIKDTKNNGIYFRLINRVILDSVPRSIGHKTKLNHDNSMNIITQIPYFEYKLFIDPDFSSLLNNDNGPADCSSNNNKKLASIVGGTIAGAAVLASISFVIYKKRIFLKEKKTLRIKLNKINK